jgi:hypothetical protein
MTAYQPEQWHDLFVAMAGAAAALTGLIFGFVGAVVNAWILLVEIHR